MQSRIASDGKDREGIRNKLRLFIDPLAPSTDSQNIVNIASGLVLPNTVNVHDAVHIGTEQLKKFKKVGHQVFICLYKN